MNTRNVAIVRWLASILAVIGLALGGLAAVGTSTALAYVACQTSSSATLSQSSAPGGSTVDFTATFKDCNGNPVAGVQVTFSQQSGPGNCHVTFSSTTATTNAQGQATVTVTLPKNCPGQFILSAAGQGVQVQAALVETGGFPNTGGTGIPSPPSNAWMLIVALGTLLTLLGSASLAITYRKGI